MTLAEFRLTSLPVTVSKPLGRNDSAYLPISFRSVPYVSLSTFAPFSNCGEALRLAIESGLPLVKDRLRARERRARTEAQ